MTANNVLKRFFWIAFAVFLLASISHVAYFFKSFEPDGLYWWVVAYAIAISVDITIFLLSLTVAELRRRDVETWLVGSVWVFIVGLAALSWYINWQYAVQFASNMLSKPSSYWFVAMINPVIASCFQALAIAYTWISDKIAQADEQVPMTMQTTVQEIEQVSTDVQTIVQQITPLITPMYQIDGRKGAVYTIANTITGDCYIGSSLNLVERWKEHERLLLSGKHHCTKLQEAYNEYGYEAFEYSIIEEVEDHSQSFLLFREQFYIDSMQPVYNVARSTNHAYNPERETTLQQIYRLNKEGKTRREIAQQVGVSPSTVQNKLKIEQTTGKN